MIELMPDVLSSMFLLFIVYMLGVFISKLWLIIKIPFLLLFLLAMSNLIKESGDTSFKNVWVYYVVIIVFILPTLTRGNKNTNTISYFLDFLNSIFLWRNKRRFEAQMKRVNRMQERCNQRATAGERYGSWSAFGESEQEGARVRAEQARQEQENARRRAEQAAHQDRSDEKVREQEREAQRLREEVERLKRERQEQDFKHRQAQKKDPYTVLGVTREMSLSEIRSIYIDLCQIYHPDKGKIKDYTRFMEIDEAFKEIKKEKA